MLGFSQDVWTKKTNYPKNVFASFAFALNNTGYVGMGWDPVGINDVYAYNATTNSWTQKGSFPGPFLSHATAFVIKNRAYMGTGSGFFNNVYTETNQFWMYNPDTDQWTRKSDFGGTARTLSVAFVIDTIAFVGTGGGNAQAYKDFWKYDFINDTWEAIADFPGGKRTDAVAFTLKGKGYVGLGFSATGVQKDIWAYDPILNTWEQKADFPVARQQASAFVINNTAYVGCGTTGNTSTVMNDFWKYDLVNDTWERIDDIGTFGRTHSVSFVLNNKGYVGTGVNASGGSPYLNDFWEFGHDQSLSNVDALASAKITLAPNPTSDLLTITCADNYSTSTIVVMNALGEVVLNSSPFSEKQITLSTQALPSGLYFIYYQDANSFTFINKALVMH